MKDTDKKTFKWILWGAGRIGKKVAKFLGDFDENIECFVDSDPKKNNSFIDGIVVKDKQILNNLSPNYIVCVAIAQDTLEIKRNIQNDYNIEEKRVLSYLECWRDVIEMHIEELTDIDVKTKENASKNIIFGMTNGLGLGGIETWSITMGNILKKEGYTIKYFVPHGKRNIAYDCVETSSEDILGLGNKKDICEDVKILSKNLPCVFFSDRISRLLQVAYICKKLFPGKLLLILVIHGGREENIKKHLFFSEWVDSYIGVSQKGICEKVVNYGIPRDKVFNVICPVKTMKNFDRAYSLYNEEMQIGYAARIDFSDKDKRQDYLLKLLLVLSETSNKYHVNIAGDGPSQNKLEGFIEEYSLQKMVTLHGYIEREKMDSFWRKQDIFINVSDSEGNCMAMMEAMGQGVVPVLTDVSGVRDSIMHGENGFIVNKGDISGIAHHIDYLYHKRDLLKNMGEKGWEWIRQKYDEEHALEGILNSCGNFKRLKEG